MSVQVQRTPEREPAITAWLASEKQMVDMAFGPEAWARVGDFIESVPWVTDADQALAWATDRNFINREFTAEETVRDVAGRRTVAAMTYHEQTLAMADRLGIRYEEMDRKRQEMALELAAELIPAGVETALYRHFDADDVLLYIGISESPELRAEQHKARSGWWRFVARTEIDWFNSRVDAAKSERTAIRDEFPIFNKNHNRSNRDAAIGYLLKALAAVSA